MYGLDIRTATGTWTLLALGLGLVKLKDRATEQRSAYGIPYGSQGRAPPRRTAAAALAVAPDMKP